MLITINTPQRQHSANVLEAPKSYAQQEPAKAQNILTMDCRGLEFVEFKADVSLALLSYRRITDGTNATFQKGEFKAKGIESNTPFAAIDLSEGEWYDYDDKAGEEVSIKDIKWEIRRA